MGARDGERRFFFVKVMKTAGGTLLQQILANFEREQVYPYERYDPDMETANYGIDYLTGLSAERRDAIRVFTGHFPFVAVELLGMELTTITILRDPVERTLSYLRHCKRHHEQHRDLALEEIYEDPFFYPCFIENHQAKQFAFTVEDQPADATWTCSMSTAARLELAKANLARVDVVGLQERFDDLLEELHERYGWTVAAVANRNVSDGEGDGVAESFRRRIAADNEADMEFYEFARELCEQRRHDRGRRDDGLAAEVLLLPSAEDGGHDADPPHPRRLPAGRGVSRRRPTPATPTSPG